MGKVRRTQATLLNSAMSRRGRIVSVGRASSSQEAAEEPAGYLRREEAVEDGRSSAGRPALNRGFAALSSKVRSLILT